MKTLNKSLLAAATVSALALSGVASAAVLTYPAGTQITHAREMAAIGGNNFIVQDGFTVAANLATELNRLNQAVYDGVSTPPVGSVLRVRVTLGGAEFGNSYNNAALLAGLFQLGAQAGVPNDSPIVPGNISNASFSGAGREELTFDYRLTAPGNGGATAPGDYLIRLPDTLEIGVLQQSIGQGSVVNATVSVQVISTPAIVGPPVIAANAGVGPVLSGNGVLARSQWGLTLLPQGPNLNQPVADQTKLIDVGSQNNRYTRFTSNAGNGAIGSSNPAPGPAGSLYYNAGGFQLDVSQAQVVGGGGLAKVLGATAPVQYSVNTGATYTVQVTGDNLSPWAPATQSIWLTTNATCAAPVNPAHVLAVNVATNTATSGAISALDPLFLNITNTPAPAPTPAAGPVYVCFSADSTTPLIPQTALAGTVRASYNLPLQRRQDNPAIPFQLVPFDINGTVIAFQNVNPGGNTNAQSFLRLTNHNPTACPVTIDAKDDSGRLSNQVQLTLGAHQSEQLLIDALESGTDNRSPARFTTGLVTTGTMNPGEKWYVRVLFECTNVAGSAWNRNLSTLSVTTLNQEWGVGTQWSANTANRINP